MSTRLGSTLEMLGIDAIVHGKEEVKCKDITCASIFKWLLQYKIMKHFSVSRNKCNTEDEKEKKEPAHVAVGNTVPMARATSSFVWWSSICTSPVALTCTSNSPCEASCWKITTQFSFRNCYVHFTLLNP